jgi:hypothetical protein
MKIVAADPNAGVRVIDGDVGWPSACAARRCSSTRARTRTSTRRRWLSWARAGDMAVVELAPSQFRAFNY